MILREVFTKLGLKTDDTAFKKGDKSINKLVVGLKLLAGAFVAGKAAKAMFGVAKQVAALGDDIDKTSRRIGVNAQALQELRFAANLAGASNQDVTKSLRTLAKNAFEAQKGTRSFVEDFQKLGVTVTDSSGRLKPAEQLLTEFGDGMQRLKSDSERLALAQKLLGRSGTALIPLFAQGSEAIKEQRAELGQLGALLDKELIESSVEFTDNQLRVASAFQGVRNALARELFPVLIRAQKFFINLVKANQDFIRGDLARFVGRVVRAFGGLATGVFKVVGAFNDWLDQMDPLQRSLLSIGAIAAGLAVLLLLPGGSLLLLAGLLFLLIDDFSTWAQGGESAIGLVIDAFSGLLDQFPVLRDVLTALSPLFFAAFNGLREIVFNFTQFWIDVFTEGPEVAITRLIRRMADLGKAIVDFVFKPIREVSSFLDTVFKDLIGPEAAARLKGFGRSLDKALGVAPGTPGGAALQSFAAQIPFAGSLLPREAAQRAGFAPTVTNLVPRATASQPGAGPTVNTSTNLQITVNAAPGQDGKALSGEISQKVSEVIDRRNKQAIRALTTAGKRP